MLVIERDLSCLYPRGHMLSPLGQGNAGDADMLGKYRIVRELGRGGMGVVYLAIDTDLHREVAIKVLPQTRFRDEKQRLRFLREARAAAAFSHPNIVHVHALSLIDEVPIIEMEYVRGGALDELAASRRLSLLDIVRFAHDIASALAYCHAQGAIHRDIKPGNILVDESGAAKLADFGLAKVFDELLDGVVTTTHSALFTGTPRYAPPEAWRGEPPDHLWDLYSLGSVIYELVGGTAPYEGQTTLEIAQRVANEEPPELSTLNSEAPEALCDLVRVMIAPNAEHRIQSAAAVVERLEQVIEVEGLAAKARPIVRLARDSQTTMAVNTTASSERTTPMTRSALAAVAAIAIAVVGWFIVSGLLETTDSAATAFAPVQSPERSDSVFEVVVDGEIPHASEQWLLQRNDHGEVTRFVAQADGYLAMLDVVESNADGYRTVQGHWGGFFDTEGGIFRSGALHGRLLLNESTGQCAGSLELIAQQSGQTYRVSVAGLPSGAEETPQTWSRTLLDRPRALPLLKSELAPRHEAWAEELEALLSPTGSPPAWVQLPVHSRGIKADGRLDEPGWMEATVLPADGSSAGPPEIRLLLDSDSLCVALHIPAGTDVSKPRLVLNIRDRFPVPVDSIAPFRLTADTSGARGGRGEAAPRQFTVPSAVHTDETGWYLECRVPLALQEGLPLASAVDVRWHLTAELHDITEGLESLKARWGSAEAPHPRHGIPLRLAS